ncbi:DUF1850 domain-containing protein [Anaerosolibacter sp.]|uniref:DUF1850 domain-containing protein n=1 Tax=Anaerosolibacter sp. TaxID=1872527 RepID=UPI002618FFA0|nr:DUF1850 domain-containing protein [Anaerosolibacter sp.]
MNKKIIVLLIMLILILSTKVVVHGKVLIVEDVDNDMKKEFFLPEDVFTLGYIHSVLLTPAEEFFQVKQDNTLMLYKTVYESFGVGLPYSQEEWQFDMENNKFVLKIERPFPSIKLRVSPIPEHWISIGEDRYEMLDLVAEPDDLVEIYAEDRWGLKLGKKYHMIF